MSRTPLLAAAVALAVLPATSAADASPRPNVVIVLADDMGFSDLGCYGGEIRTPNLDALAANGLRFTQFYNTARCCPTRAALLTGLYSHQAGMGHMTNDRGGDGYRGDLNNHCVTIAEALKPAGYGTYAVGKWHVTKHTGPNGPKDNWPLQRGFDRYYGTINGAGNYFGPDTLTRDNTRIDSAHDPEYKPEHFYYTDAITDHAIRFVADHRRQSADKPFFLYVAYTAAHWPLHAPDEEIAKYHGQYDGGYEPVRKARFEREQKLGLIDPKWELSPQAGDWSKVTHKPWEARRMEVYAAMVSRMDQGIGRIVAQLRESGQLDNTLFLFLQDNGACAEVIHRGPEKEQPTDRMPGPADTFLSYGKEWANVSNTPFREYKHWVHEGGISTPLIVHWPARVKDHGSLRQQPGHLVDLMATCLEASGAKYPERFKDQPVTPLEGRSLMPAFDNRPVERDAIYWEHEGNRAVRQGQWKLVAKSPGGKWELYDVAADRTELHDLAAEQPERVRDLAAKWEAWAKRANVLPWIWRPAYGAAASAVDSRRFELRPGEDLPREEAPQVAGKGLTITAVIEQSAADGVLVAQGGSSQGYSLYLKDGKPAFATRHDKKLAVVTAKEALPAAPVTLTAVLAADGTVTLAANGKALGSGKVSGPLAKMPGEGLQVGRDTGSAVGEYAAPFPFTGRLGKVVVELGQ